MRKWQIFLLEDDPGLRDLLVDHLNASGHQVQSCRTLTEAYSLLEQWTPDLVLLDLNLPDGDGLDLIPTIQSLGNLPVLIITARGSVPDRVQGLNQGADDYLIKPFAMDEFDARIKALLRRVHPQEQVMILAGTTLDINKCTLLTEQGNTLLTDHELRIMEYLMQNASRVVSREVLEQYVYGWYIPASNSIEVRVSVLRKKLRQIGSQLNIRALRKAGYALFVEE
ncbi:response regulator transcription factor [Deinococcus cellulosilyticus]|uniref:DNA-binding response regulator n=1 Tax=Deinococcus cellulosilyticus (strain DSM 18568 / NBRC 106333 / KACC 11606 / 5516J-15) TaxID=1223518 RepID=A0A511MWK5_DEIC1|nr:response regulator transcription factor [Deinococcus cellulosilyticus]GEM44963.1 DNA-binding response regulator [Deinococcus cellulosilyticus NBRC 106333 = KACC 11606]